MKRAARILVLVALSASVLPAQPAARTTTNPSASDPRKIRVNGVELHYVERGKGVPIVFIHGGGGDYRDWEEQIEPFARKYRVVAYSRRYSYPNRNPAMRDDHSALVEAEDLDSLIRALKLEPVHLVGASYGAYTALILALRHPAAVRSLVLAEPPVLRWAKEAGKEAIFEQFLRTAFEPAGRAFRDGDPQRAMRILIDGIDGPGTFDQIPAPVLRRLMEDSRDMEALTRSRDAFPNLSRDDVRHLKTPTMLLTGERTSEINRIGDRELDRLLPKKAHLVITGATHEMWTEFPMICGEATLAFIDAH